MLDPEDDVFPMVLEGSFSKNIDFSGLRYSELMLKLLKDNFIFIIYFKKLWQIHTIYFHGKFMESVNKKTDNLRSLKNIFHMNMK